jgi:cytochrome bd ubiquinol oxidase subunit I
VYGYYLPAKLRVGLSAPQAATTLTVLVGGVIINRMMLKGAFVHGPIQWGKISLRGMAGLFGLAVAFTWVMGLMGYIRSSGRLAWHVSELMADVSPWAFTPDFAFAAKMVTLNMMVFWGAVLALFWMCQRDKSPAMGEELAEGNARVLVPPSSSQEA